MYASFRSVGAKNDKILTLTRTENFLLTRVNGLGILRDAHGRKNGFAHWFALRKHFARMRKLRGKSAGGKIHSKWWYNWLLTTPCKFISVQMWHLPSLPQIYCSVFPFLLYICEGQSFANPFFRSVCYLLARRIETGRFQSVAAD